MKISSWLGLDISKNKVDCCLMMGEQLVHFIIENNQSGFNNLLDKLNSYLIDVSQLHVCCEATNVYYLPIASFCFEQKMKISVVNPAIIQYFAKYQLKRVKTDKQDAKLIAQYCQKEKPQLWQPENLDKKQLKSLHRRIEQLQQLLTMEKNRLKVADEFSQASIKKMIAYLSEEITLCRKQMKDFIERNEQLKHRQEILQSITGIGFTTAQILLIVMMDIERFPTARHLVSWLGLSPIIKDSGERKGQSVLSRMGDRSIRKALYMPARAACTRSKLWRSWFERQIQRGKHPKQVYVMMMVKLVKYAYTCIKNNVMFDEARHQDGGAEAKGV